MRRTTGQVRAVEMVVRVPIESANWFIEEATAGGAGEKEAAELLRQDLFSDLDGPWSDVIREGCLGVHSGTRIPEIVWEERAGRLAVKDLASRNPELLERWPDHPDRQRIDPAPGVHGSLYSVVLPSKCSSSASAALRVA